MRRRVPPRFIPIKPSSHPLITCPWPSAIVMGCAPRSQELSNFLPVLWSQPVYCTVILLPVFTAWPQPTCTSVYLSPSGNVTGVPARAGGLAGPADGVGVLCNPARQEASCTAVAVACTLATLVAVAFALASWAAARSEA